MSEPLYTLDVDGVGLFRFKRQSRIRNQLAVEAVYESTVSGIEHVSKTLENMARAYAGLKVLTVESPEGWDLDGLDLTDPDHAAQLGKVWKAVQDKEAFFRSGGAQ